MNYPFSHTYRPLGGDAQLVAMLCQEQLGGLIFFEDPLHSHAHDGDIQSLLRNTKIYNIMHASTTITATMMMHTLRCGLEHDQPELLPSFFTSLQCPTVAYYKNGQKEVLEAAGTKVLSMDEKLDISQHLERGELASLLQRLSVMESKLDISQHSDRGKF